MAMVTVTVVMVVDVVVDVSVTGGRMSVFVCVTWGSVVVTTEVAVLVLVFVVSRGATSKLVETRAAATITAAATYA